MAFQALGISKQITSLILIYLALLAVTTQGLSIAFCSHQNTGSDSSPVFNQYQSNGACQTSCQDQYAYAVLQATDCWCSDYAPADQVDTGSCNTQCPGFPAEQCGNIGEGLFGYYALSKIQPSGTAGAAASAAPSASPTAAPSAVPSAAPSDPPHESFTPPLPPPAPTVTVQATVSNPPNPSVSVSIILSSIPQQQITASSSSGSPSPSTTLRTTSSPSPSPSTAQAPPSSSWSPTPSAVVTTVLGSIKTVIVTPTVPPPAQTQVATVNAAAPDNFWNDTEKVAGTFTAVAVVIAALIGIILFLLVRRARSHESMAIRSTSDGDNTSVTQVPYGGEKRSSKLTLATAGLGGMRRGDSNDKNTGENTPASMSRRASMPLVRDQRLDPRVLFNIENANASHTSITSFRDDRDYSRPVLHVRNPD